jgi:hypothetical protein
MDKNFLQSISNFRAIAIVLIVAGHTYKYGFTGEGAVSSIVRNIITGGTALFVFISGYMFHYIFYNRYDYKKFVVNKIKNVGIPYLILGSVCIIVLLIFSKGYYRPITEHSHELSKFEHLFKPDDSKFLSTIKYYSTGSFLVAYWYIPFVLLLFLMAPLHVKFITITKKYQILIIFFLSIISIFVHRPVANTNPIHALVYYTPIYLIGILVSLHSNKVRKYLKGNILLLLLAVIIMSSIQYLTNHQGNSHKPFFEYAGVDLMYIQKMFLIFFMYGALEKYKFQSTIVDTISKTSFAIFFIHPWILFFLIPLSYSLEKVNKNFLLYFFITFIVLITSVFTALLVKKVFKGSKHSRLLIGY